MTYKVLSGTLNLCSLTHCNPWNVFILFLKPALLCCLFRAVCYVKPFYVLYTGLLLVSYKVPVHAYLIVLTHTVLNMFTSLMRENNNNNYCNFNRQIYQRLLQSSAVAIGNLPTNTCN